MKLKFFGILLCPLLSLPCVHAQEIKTPNQQQIDSGFYFSGEIIDPIEVSPEFSGGQDSLTIFLKENIHYPEAARDAKIEGVVYVTFIIETDGSVSNLKIARSIGYGCDEEAMRVVQAMPVWKPGTQSGKPVRMQYILPVRFPPENVDK